MRGHDTDRFLFHLVICFDSCVFKDFLSDTLGKTLKELLHCVVVHWVISSLMSDALEFRDVLIYLWPSHFQHLQFYSGSLGFLGVHEAIVEVHYELLVCGIIVVCRL